MRRLMMRGMAITGVRRFQEYFCPRDLLRQREVAAGFLYLHFRNLSAVDLYHAEVFYDNVFTPPEVSFPLMIPQEYTQVMAARSELERHEKPILNRYFLEPETMDRMQACWKLAQAAGLDDVETGKLYCLLMAGYSLAEKTLPECPITPEEARLAYQRRESAEEESRWLRVSATGTVALEARQAPYRILMGQDAESRLEKGAEITPRKILALPHAQGNHAVPVTLELYASAEDPQPRTVQVYAGDYRYMNFVEDIPVLLHPVVQETPACRVERRDRDFYYEHKGNPGKSRVYRNVELEIIGFAAEENAAGYLLLTDKGLDTYAYSAEEMVSLPEHNVVQAAFRGTECLLLDKNGRVFSSYADGYLPQVRVTALEALLR